MRTRQAVIAGVLALAILGLAATTAAAQEAPARAGFWGGFGMGWGSMGVGCGGCGGAERLGSYSGYLKLGGTLNPHVLLGGEFNGWSKSENGVTVDFGNASAAAYYYPDVQSGLFVKGGAGYSRLGAHDGGASDSESGFGLLAGVGYDVRIAENTSITPVFNYFRGAFDGGHADVFQFGVGVTFH